MIENGSSIEFYKKKDYIMVNNNLGAGSFGKTVLLKDPFIDELFVSKKYDPEDIEDREEFYNTFLQEIKLMHKLNHRNVVRVYNYYAYPDKFTGYILMEFIDGKNIGSYFKNHLPWNDEPTPDEIFVQLIDGFSYIESQGIIHRDIREGNVMLDNNGIVKIIDFGLGKTYKPIQDKSSDSLVGIINRQGLDKLPNEYYEGKYTSKTDMFYLAEMYGRLLRESDYYKDFTYTDILNKMMEEDEKDRYSSFEDIKIAIEQQRFSITEVPDEEKEIYQEFSSGIYSLIACYTSYEKEYVEDVAEFIEKIKNVMEKNCFEDIVQNNVDVIRTIVKSNNYKYYKGRCITYKAIKDFYIWILHLSMEMQIKVLNNLKAKISNIEVRIEDELPF